MSKKFTSTATKALKNLIAKYKEEHKGSKRIQWSEEIMETVVDYHYETGKDFTAVSKDLGINAKNVGNWKKVYGKERTGFVFGKGIRNDVRTKALCVQESIETKITQHELARKYGVSIGTVANWVKQYTKEYKELLDSKDGIPYFVKSEKMVYGDKNIEKVLKLLDNHKEELGELIEAMHREGVMPNAIKQVENKEKHVTEDIKTLNEANEILKKQAKK